MPGAIVLESFLELAEAKITSPGWLWGDIVQRQAFTVIHTGAKRAKSFWTMNFAVALAAGFPTFLDLEVFGPARTVILQREVHRYGMQERLLKMAAHAPLPGVDARAMANIAHNVSRAHRLHDLKTFRDFHSLMRDVRPDLIVLDPLAHVLVENENDNAMVGQSLERIAALRDDPGSAVIVVHHNRKENEATKGVDPTQNARGADRIIADADAVISLVRGRKHNLGPCSRFNFTLRNSVGSEPFYAVFNKSTAWWERTYERGDVEKIAQWIDGAGGAMSFNEIEIAVKAEWGLYDKTHHRAVKGYLDKAVESGVLEERNKTYYRAKHEATK